MTERKKYSLRFMFDYFADSVLWVNNDAAYDKFDIGPISPHKLPLSAETLRKVVDLNSWWQAAGMPTSSFDPWPLWRQDECDRFNTAVEEVFAKVQEELGDEYQLVDKVVRMREDPDLDEFLSDPEGFYDRRMKKRSKRKTGLAGCFSIFTRFLRFVK